MSQAESTLELDVQSLFLSSNRFGPREIQGLRTAMARDPAVFRDLRIAVADLKKRPDPSPATKVRLGVGCYLLGEYDNAVEYLAKADGSAMARYYLAKSQLARGEQEQAFEAFEAAAKAGYNKDDTKLGQVEALRMLKKRDEALEMIESLTGEVTRAAEYLYQKGATLSVMQRESSEVRALYEQAVTADGRHAGALFGLALEEDRRGNDDQALILYERGAEQFPPHVGTLLNLGILYEDRGRFDHAAECYRRIIKAYPDRTRARMFLKDAEASMTMFIDEAAERQSSRIQQRLALPVTDFELSVRSRNCLQKMGVASLGDLIKYTEQDLLASKNFGETSLNEIRQMLADNDLRLGMAAEPKRPAETTRTDTTAVSADEQAMLSKSVFELNLSVRAKKCMNRLGIATIGELVRCTGDDLLECKNFGVTSLNEVREKLTVFGLKLRGE